MPLDPKFIINLKGKDFVLFAGLLDMAHQAGLIAIEHEVMIGLSNPSEQQWVVRSIGRFKSEDGDAIWTAHGDASPANSQMRGAYLRHAETRAAARMLRMATNVGMTAFEEMGPDAESQPTPAYKPDYDPNERPQVKHWPTCKQCHAQLTRGEVDCCRQAGIDHYCTEHAPGRERHTHGGKTCAECGTALTDAQAMVSRRKYNQALCPAHQRAAKVTS